MTSHKIYKIIISKRAMHMLGEHINFLSKVNKEAAKQKKKQIIESIRSLATMPERFPYFEEDYIPRSKYHKLFIKDYYIVLYQIKDDTVEVDYIIDCRKDYKWLS